MDEDITIERNGAKIVFRDPLYSAKRWLDSYRVDLITDGMSATVRVENAPYGTSPNAFIKDLADNWRGWKGEKKWRSMEDELTLVAESDSCGHITITASIHPDVFPPHWSAKLSVSIDAGELDQLQRVFDRYFGYDTQQRDTSNPQSPSAQGTDGR